MPADRRLPPARLRYQARVAEVEEGSVAGRMGIQPGHRLLAINGEPPWDVIDYYLAEAEQRVSLLLSDEVGKQYRCEIEKDPDEPIGLRFTSDLFKPLKTCNNACEFCFVLQGPADLRPTVYVKDDDYRLSFLHGHFVTLTNLTERDIERILRHRLSPLHVSVHATNPDLRLRLLGNPKANAGLVALHRLMAGGIQVHTQLVLCPGINDGEELERSIGELASWRPGVLTVGVVPVGLTRYQRHPHLRCYTQTEARQVLAQLAPWQRRFRSETGETFVYASDEFYFLAGEPLPPAECYDGFPQFDNGIGNARLFRDQARQVIARLPARVPCPVRAAVITGVLGEWAVTDLVQALNRVEGLQVELVTVTNAFFGQSVTATGLLTGQDIAAALAKVKAERAFLPRLVLNADGLLLDDWTPQRVAEVSGIPVEPLDPTPHALATALGVLGDEVGRADEPEWVFVSR